MTHRLLAALALLVAVPSAAADPDAQRGGPSVRQWTQLSIHERIVIRIPRMPRPPPPLPGPYGEPPPRWTEHKADRCVPAAGIAGATVPAAGRVDLVMYDGARTRALLEADCPALDYYLGFYIKPTEDGLVCAGRDPIRSRSGAACPIRAFRRLVPKRHGQDRYERGAGEP